MVKLKQFPWRCSYCGKANISTAEACKKCEMPRLAVWQSESIAKDGDMIKKGFETHFKWKTRSRVH